MPHGRYGLDSEEEPELRAGATRGKAPMDRGNVREESEDRRGAESLDPGTDRLRGTIPFGGTLRESVWDRTARPDTEGASEDEDGEEEEDEGGLLLLLGASVLPWCCSRRWD